MKHTLTAKTYTLRGTIALPASKSIANRLLIVQAIAGCPITIHNVGDADDTETLAKALRSTDHVIDVGPAGTAMRFLTAHFANAAGERVLTGSARMKERPIGPLVDALVNLGARIHYIEKPGCPPLRIDGRKLKGGQVSIAGNISSQFITALMLLGPTLPQPLTITIAGPALSRPYLKMTQHLMHQCGAVVSFDGSNIEVANAPYRPTEITVEADWSAAAFWMAIASASRKADLLLTGLKSNSAQGDQKAIELFSQLGVKSNFETEGLRIQTGTKSDVPFEYDFSDHPDLVQPIVVACAAQGRPFSIRGLDNLRLKETDRIQALCSELAKVGLELTATETTLTSAGNALTEPTEEFNSHDDHRMAMSLALMALKFQKVSLRNPQVVGKSYPYFWKQLEKFIDVRTAR